MKILFIVYDFSIVGGAQKVTANLANELSKDSEVYIASMYSSHDKLAYRLEKRVSFLSLKGKGRIRTDIFFMCHELSCLIKQKGIEIIVAEGISTSLVSTITGMISGKPIVVCEHSSIDNSLYNKLGLRVFRFLSVVMANSIVLLTKDNQDKYSSKYPLFKKKFQIIPNWVEKSNIKVDYYADKRKIVTIGRADPVKGFEDIIIIASKLKNELPGWEWDIWGDFDNEYGRCIKKLAREQDVEDVVRFRGIYTDFGEISSEYAFIVLTSRFEGFSLVLLEARERGLPMISYNCHTGPSTIIEDGINGLLVEPNNKTKLKDAIVKLANDIQLREQFSSNCKVGMDQYYKENIISKWKELLINLVER